MKRDIEQVLISQEQIARRVDELARQITGDFAPGGHAEDDVEITIVPLLTGAMIFTADLIRRMPLRMCIGLLTVSSYPGTSTRTQGSTILADQIGEVRNRHVLLVDDILDSGGTIGLVRQKLLAMQPVVVKTCVLLRKPTAGAAQTPVDYVGFDIPDVFVVGYGLDLGNYYRNLPDIVTLDRRVIEAALQRSGALDR